ncbi:MAG: HipA family kinase [Thermoleophilaceae bacterium]
MRAVSATRYVTPLREGGSLPGLVEADDDGLYVAKFRGAGQGPGALVAEVVAGELARALGLPVPELVLLELDPQIGVAEPDPEIQDLLMASAGLNLGVDFLPGALGFTAAAAEGADPEFCANVVWFDGLVMNLDRTPRNPNLLTWHGRTWLIDHGAALYPQHSAAGLAASARDPFTLLAQHVLLPGAGSIAEADERLAGPAAEAAAGAIEAAPDTWLGADPDERRAEIRAFFDARLAAPRLFLEGAEAGDA